MTFLKGLLLGVVICGLPVLLYQDEDLPGAAIIAALVLAAGAFAFVNPADKWSVGFGVGAGRAHSINISVMKSWRPSGHRDKGNTMPPTHSYARPACKT